VFAVQVRVDPFPDLLLQKAAQASRKTYKAASFPTPHLLQAKGQALLELLVGARISASLTEAISDLLMQPLLSMIHG